MGLEVELSIELERIFFEDLSKHLSHIMFRTRRVVEIFGIALQTVSISSFCGTDL